jgi:hypothetical protein
MAASDHERKGDDENRQPGQGLGGVRERPYIGRDPGVAKAHSDEHDRQRAT